MDIGTIETVNQLPQILSAYMKNYQQVDLSLITGVTETLEEQVLHHQLDGAFVTESDFHSDIIAHEVVHEELVLISNKRDAALDELKEEPFLCFSKGCIYRARLEAWYREQNISPRKVLEFGTLETILRSVAIGLGVTFIPRSTATDMVEKGLIHCYSLPQQYSKIKIVFIRRADTYVTPTIAKFIETIEAHKNRAVVEPHGY